jgi:hypothetical protein
MLAFLFYVTVTYEREMNKNALEKMVLPENVLEILRRAPSVTIATTIE